MPFPHGTPWNALFQVGDSTGVLKGDLGDDEAGGHRQEDEHDVENDHRGGQTSAEFLSTAFGGDLREDNGEEADQGDDHGKE